MLNNKEHNGAEKKIAKSRVADSSFSNGFGVALKDGIQIPISY